jgi:flagellar basal-body rod protein FlgB
MMRALSTAASGMDAQQTRLDVTANNIANVSTPGFKRVRAEFAEILVDVERTPGAATSANTTSPVGIEVGMGARTMGTSRLHSQGDMQQSENPLDLAIEGPASSPSAPPAARSTIPATARSRPTPRAASSPRAASPWPLTSRSPRTRWRSTSAPTAS